MTFHEVRIAFTVEPFDQAVAFYRDSLGLAIVNVWQSEQGRGVVLALGQETTLELLDPAHAAFVDQVEVGKRVSGPVRLALAVEDVATMVHTMQTAGAQVVSEPTPTPWGDYNARLVAPDGIHITLFQSPQSATQEREGEGS